MTGIRPLGDRVVIKKAMEEKTQGGLILTSAAEGETANGGSCGSRTWNQKDEPMELKVGDKVVFSQVRRCEIKYQGEEYTIMRRAKFWRSLNKRDERGNPKMVKDIFMERRKT